MKRLLILQNSILPYRKPLYNRLGHNYELTVLHSGSKSVEEQDLYREIITPTRAVGPLRLQSEALDIVRNRNYDVIVCMFDIHWINNLITLFLRRKRRFIWWGHRYSSRNSVNLFKDSLMRLSDGVILYNGRERGRMISRGIPGDRIFVAPNTVFVPNSSDGSSGPKDSFLFVGRAQERKRIDLLISAFSEILDRIPPNVKLNIVGSGAENERLRSLSRQLGVSQRVSFHGEVLDPEQLKIFFHRAYAYVSPGHVGLGVLHSFAYGTPVVTQSNGSHAQEFEDVVDQVNSLTFRTYPELKEILVTLCRDDGVSKELGGRAYAFYRRERTMDEMVAGFVAAVENVA